MCLFQGTYKRALKAGICIVSSLWVEACKVKQVRVSENLFPIATDYTKMAVKPRVSSQYNKFFSKNHDFQKILGHPAYTAQGVQCTHSTSLDGSSPRVNQIENIHRFWFASYNMIHSRSSMSSLQYVSSPGLEKIRVFLKQTQPRWVFYVL